MKNRDEILQIFMERIASALKEQYGYDDAEQIVEGYSLVMEQIGWYNNSPQEWAEHLHEAKVDGVDVREWLNALEPDTGPLNEAGFDEDEAAQFVDDLTTILSELEVEGDHEGHNVSFSLKTLTTPNFASTTRSATGGYVMNDIINVAAKRKKQVPRNQIRSLRNK